MKPIFTGLAPNTEIDDAFLAWKLLFQPWRWNRGEATKKLEEEFKKYLPIKYAHAFISGRAALFAILQTLNLQEGDEVLLQAYTCVAVPDPVLWVGAKPIYVDCNANTLNMLAEDLKKKITPRSKVLIIQHTFGLPADLDNLLHIAREHNLFVIEDCAHALGSTYHNQKVGTFGHAAIFSFGRDKVISSVFGGMAVTNQEEVSHKLKKIQQNYNYPGLLWVLQQLIHPVVTTKAKFFYKAGLGKIILILAKKLHLISKAVYNIERHGQMPAFVIKRMPNALAILALHQFKKLEVFNNHRRKVAQIYCEQIKKTHQGIKSTEIDATGLCAGHIYLRYTIFAQNATAIFNLAKAQNIYLGDWYRTPIAPDRVDYKVIGYTVGSCPNAEKAAMESINLPTDIHIPANAQSPQMKALIQLCSKKE